MAKKATIEDYIYLDNAGTTAMPPEVIKEIGKWFNCGNPSSSYHTAALAKEKIAEFKKTILAFSSFNQDAEVIITSCASEANNFIVRQMISSAKYRPHVLISAIEHKSIIGIKDDIADAADIETIPVNKLGFIETPKLEKRIRPNTILVCLIAVGNENGAENDIEAAASVCKAYGVPLHIDAVQYFPKYGLLMPEAVTSAAISFHKLGGPPGIGALIVDKDIIENKELKAAISGSQNSGLRGGTENVPYIAGAIAAMKINFAERDKKNAALQFMREKLLFGLATEMLFMNILEFGKYWNNPMRDIIIDPYIVLISPLKSGTLNIVLFAVIDELRQVCNSRMKKELESRGIIVSIGSACNTSSYKASHVLYAMNLPPIVRRGTLRVSFGDGNNTDDIYKFVYALKYLIMNGLIYKHNHE